MSDITNYAKRGENYSKRGNKAHSITKNNTTFYYSYNTCIAFRHDGKLTIRKNDWSTATGQHLNSINPDKSIRIEGKEFEAALKEIENKLEV